MSSTRNFSKGLDQFKKFSSENKSLKYKEYILNEPITMSELICPHKQIKKKKKRKENKKNKCLIEKIISEYYLLLSFSLAQTI
ncbi:hypothetical protein BpHYR1_023408 [Brachionus plicatilis]|uniref:Uncharacterized protein n=1 Tax=Brachionus plicatilis TaxID=10195 RepID=A0A3M7QYX6_BRAPC|nr:hypothetical protein BpHYR1_023408 [Brachionus plicatilis]